MTVVNPPIFMEAEEYHSQHLRFGLNLPFDLPMPITNAENDSGYPHSGGVFPNVTSTSANTDNPLSVTSTGGLGISVAQGTCIIDTSGIGATLPGVYIGRNEGATTLTLAARDATQARKDIIYAGFIDSANGGATNEFVIAARTGNAAASPVPNITTSIGSVNRWIPLAVATVPGGDDTPQTVTIADRRQWVGARGGVRLARNSNYYGDNPHWGDLRFDLSDDTYQIYQGHGGGWGAIATRGWAFGYEDNLRDHWRPVAIQHNVRKRSGVSGYEATPGVEGGGGNWSPINATEVTTPAFQTPTGRAIVMITATMQSEGSTNARMAFRIINDAGNTPNGANGADPIDSNSALWPGSNNGTVTWQGVVTGLPTATRSDVSGSNPSQNRLYARMMFRTTDGGQFSYFQDCNLTVIPIV
jgi:hypothetical protein